MLLAIGERFLDRLEVASGPLPAGRSLDFKDLAVLVEFKILESTPTINTIGAVRRQARNNPDGLRAERKIGKTMNRNGKTWLIAAFGAVTVAVGLYIVVGESVRRMELSNEGGRSDIVWQPVETLHEGLSTVNENADSKSVVVQLPVIGSKDGEKRTQNISFFNVNGEEIAGSWNIYSDKDGWFSASIEKEPVAERASGIAGFEFVCKNVRQDFVIEPATGPCSAEIEDILARVSRAFPSFENAKQIDLVHLRASNRSLTAVTDSVLVMAWGRELWPDSADPTSLGLAIFVEVNGDGVGGEPIHAIEEVQ